MIVDSCTATDWCVLLTTPMSHSKAYKMLAISVSLSVFPHYKSESFEAMNTKFGTYIRGDA